MNLASQLRLAAATCCVQPIAYHFTQVSTVLAHVSAGLADILKLKWWFLKTCLQMTLFNNLLMATCDNFGQGLLRSG